MVFFSLFPADMEAPPDEESPYFFSSPAMSGGRRIAAASSPEGADFFLFRPAKNLAPGNQTAPPPKQPLICFSSSSISPQPITKTTASHQIFSLFLTEPHCPDDPLPLILFFFFPRRICPPAVYLLPPAAAASAHSRRTQLLSTDQGTGRAVPIASDPRFPSPASQQRLLLHQRCQFFPFDLFHNNRPAADLIASHSSPDTAPTEANRRSATLLLHD
uniref:Uncharacterized protein n=1 Tax=Populus alba TaxID=43335 RepID=A0A4V6AC53_POPAL|nr:hypothetical protein D5086_0000012120 [Populus alba]